MVKEMLSTADLAAALNIGREAARRLMMTTRGVVTLPPLGGKGNNKTRRMPRAVLESLLSRRGTTGNGGVSRVSRDR